MTYSPASVEATAAVRTRAGIAIRSRASFVITRPLLGPRHGSIGGLRGHVIRTPEYVGARFTADTRTIALADACPLLGLDTNRWPEIAVEVEATRFSCDQRIIKGRMRLALDGIAADFDAIIHDVGSTPAGEALPKRGVVAVRATLPRGLLLEALPDSIRWPQWRQLSKLDVQLHLEYGESRA